MSHALPTLAPLVIPDPRMSTDLVHRRLRELIYSGELPGGTVLSQLQLSKALGVSRTPLREAFRMLQEEGLIEGEPNRRCRVTGFDSADVDAIYGTRLMLEALGMRLTLPGLSAESLARAQLALAEMDADSQPGTSEAWRDAHHRFHGVFTSGSSQPLNAQITATAHRADRYVRLMASGHPLGSPMSAQDHHTILSLVLNGRHEDAIAQTARHLARTALMLLADVHSEFEPVTIRSALSFIIGGDPARIEVSGEPMARLRRRSS